MSLSSKITLLCVTLLTYILRKHQTIKRLLVHKLIHYLQECRVVANKVDQLVVVVAAVVIEQNTVDC
jgi:hypothetical protein